MLTPEAEAQPAAPQLSPEDAAAAAEAGIGLAPKEEKPAEGGAKERPEYIPEKFWDAEKGVVRTEEMAKSYAELEKGKGAEEAPGGEEQPAEEAAKEAVTNAGLDFDAMRAEFTESGELSEDTMAALEKGGIPREVVDQYLAGVGAQAAAIRTSILDAAGGEEGYQSLLAWAGASDTVSEADANAFNEAVNSGKADVARMAIAGMVARQRADGDVEPSRQFDGSGGSSSSDVYASSAQVTKDMNDPRYGSDPAFRAAVAAKLGRSPDF